jgi:predicted HTH domain antitoxin
MNPTMRTVVLDDELAALIEGEGPLDQTARETIVMDLFRRGRISTGKACELLGLERMAFVRRAAELDVPVYLTTEEELKADVATLEAWRQHRS